MDSSAMAKVEQEKRHRRSIAEKRNIVEQTMLPGASVAAVARQHGVTANMVFYWRNLYRQGRLGEKRSDSIRLLPVSVSEPAANPVLESETRLCSTPAVMSATAAGSIHIEFPKVHLRIERGADAGLLRVVLESLPR
ncbi:MAG: transposase [Candidatus Korobacteraceae bacterium]